MIEMMKSIPGDYALEREAFFLFYRRALPKSMFFIGWWEEREIKGGMVFIVCKYPQAETDKTDMDRTTVKKREKTGYSWLVIIVCFFRRKESLGT